MYIGLKKKGVLENEFAKICGFSAKTPPFVFSLSPEEVQIIQTPLIVENLYLQKNNIRTILIRTI
jgi:hypothetical protein